MIRNAEEMPRPLETIPMNQEWKEGIKTHWWAVNYTGKIEDAYLPMYKMRDKLLSFGGEEVCMVYKEPDLDNILSRGQFWYGDKSIMKKGRPCGCHANSCHIWATRGEKNISICTGYALSTDGMWRQHSWCIQKNPRSIKIIETTSQRVAYFGFIMTDEEANMFYNQQL